MLILEKQSQDREEENVGKCGWGTRNREGQALVELMARNGLSFVGSFFQKRETHKITYRSGHHKTELDLVLIRKEQLWKIKDCKAIAGEHTTTQQASGVRCSHEKDKTKQDGSPQDNQVVEM